MTFIELVENIKKFEGFRATAYKCPAGVWTIGYGRTENVTPTSVTNKESEDEWIKKEVSKRLEYVQYYNQLHKYNWTKNMQYALTDFIFNLGYSAIVKLTDRGNRDNITIADKLLEYCNANGKSLEGLKKRRQWEKDLFQTMEEPIKTVRKARLLFRINNEWLEFTGYCTDTDKAIFKNMSGKEIEIDEDIKNQIQQITFYADESL